MFTLTRISTTPANPFDVVAHVPQPGDQPDRVVGLRFYPAGSTEGPTTHQADDVVTAAIMDDPGLAGHFECTPRWPPVKAHDAPDVLDDQPAPKSRKATV